MVQSVRTKQLVSDIDGGAGCMGAFLQLFAWGGGGQKLKKMKTTKPWGQILLKILFKVLVPPLPCGSVGPGNTSTGMYLNSAPGIPDTGNP